METKYKFLKVGNAWNNKSGKGINISIRNEEIPANAEKDNKGNLRILLFSNEDSRFNVDYNVVIKNPNYV